MDYSQIKLRIWLSSRMSAIKAFQEERISIPTAMRVFGIERPEDVTANDRHNAKSLWSGYGISDFSFVPNNLGIGK